MSAALELAEALLGHELRSTELAATSAMTRVLALAPVDEPISVSLNPADHAVLTGSGGGELLAGMPGAAAREITFCADPALASGDAVARCGASNIDARLSEGLRRLREYVSR